MLASGTNGKPRDEPDDWNNGVVNAREEGRWTATFNG